ncbi:hypothetical protein [uncultured Bacteroides sp.]|uniref:hypothetical protein n=1 Tax=uncultured Bacteroides sp. TaxID=162156 RepID=UPI0025DC189B|nr:hypothetical protein [uncultured Bacteroides sp.]
MYCGNSPQGIFNNWWEMAEMSFSMSVLSLRRSGSVFSLLYPESVDLMARILSGMAE